MASHTSDKIRSIAFVGHGTTGKTSLVETLLFRLKATKRHGKVDDGTSHLDFEAEEKDRKITIDAGFAHAKYEGRHIQFIDTPGGAEFIAEVLGALEAVDGAIVVVDANAGVKVNTRRVWREAARRELPRLIVLNRMDFENAKFLPVVEELQAVFGDHCLPLYFADGQGPQFKGVLPLLTPVGALSGEAQSAREQLIEAIVEGDDALLERYFDGQEIAPAELEQALARAVLQGQVFPILPTSAVKELGLDALLDAIARYLPSPAERPGRRLKAGGEGVEPHPMSAPFSALVFKSIVDPFLGALAYIKVRSGAAKVGDRFVNARTGAVLKANNFYRIFGKDQEADDSVVAGDIVALAKLEGLRIGDALHAEGQPVAFPPCKFPEPMVSVAVLPKSEKDEQKIKSSLQKLVDSDPTLKLEYEKVTSDLVFTGMSDRHLQVALNRLKARDKVEADTRLPRIPYRETINGKADVTYTHKKQTGGSGQYGRVLMRVDPLPRGGGFEFVDSVVGGNIPTSLIPAVEKGCLQAMDRGPLAGFPVCDIRADLYDGKHHPVDSKEIAFILAGKKGLQEALQQAKPVLLEPIYEIAIVTPDTFMGPITGDLSNRRGIVQGMDAGEDGYQVVKAKVPLASLLTYETELRAMTGGEATYTRTFSHYDIVPGEVAQRVIANAAKRKEEDED